MHFWPMAFCLIMHFSFVLFLLSFRCLPGGGVCCLFPPRGFWGIGYLPSATDRFIVPFDFYFGFGMAGGPGTVFC